MADINVSNKVPITYSPTGEPVTNEGAQPNSGLNVWSPESVAKGGIHAKSGVDASVGPVGRYSNLTGLAPSDSGAVIFQDELGLTGAEMQAMAYRAEGYLRAQSARCPEDFLRFAQAQPL